MGVGGRLFWLDGVAKGGWRNILVGCGWVNIFY